MNIDTSAHIAGQLAEWPSKERMASILQDAGLEVYVGDYSIRIKDCSHFVMQEYGGDMGVPCIDADADTVEQMLADGKLVSDALSKAGVVHRFEVYDHEGKLVGYQHHQWPLGDVKDDHILAHKHSIRHHDELLRSDRCGCFYCCRVFAPSEIKDWIEDGESPSERTAHCPYCDIDSVIGSASGYPITPEFLKRMNDHWFRAIQDSR